MIQLTASIQKFSIALIFLTISFALQANEPNNFMPPEVAAGTVSCKAEWNQICEDQKTIKVPEGHKLCKNTVIAKEKNGDSGYEIVSTDNKGITVKFYAKGNRDRFKQQDSSIVLNILLLGVRENVDCTSGVVTKAITTPVSEPKVAAIVEKNSAPAIETKTEVKPAETAAPTSAASTATSTITPTTQDPKPHACACSQWIDADKVFNCLANGHGRDNAKCDSYATTIQCVTSKDECRESQKENCPQIAGLNQTIAKKRIFVLNSPYCQQP